MVRILSQPQSADQIYKRIRAKYPDFSSFPSQSGVLGVWVSEAEKQWLAPFHCVFMPLVEDSLDLRPKTVAGLHDLVFDTHMPLPDGGNLGSLRELTGAPCFKDKEGVETIIVTWRQLIFCNKMEHLDDKQCRRTMIYRSVKQLLPLIRRCAPDAPESVRLKMLCSYMSALLFLCAPRHFMLWPNNKGGGIEFKNAEDVRKFYCEEYMPRLNGIRRKLCSPIGDCSFLPLMAVLPQITSSYGYLDKFMSGLRIKAIHR